MSLKYFSRAEKYKENDYQLSLKCWNYPSDDKIVLLDQYVHNYELRTYLGRLSSMYMYAMCAETI